MNPQDAHVTVGQLNTVAAAQKAYIDNKEQELDMKITELEIPAAATDEQIQEIVDMFAVEAVEVEDQNVLG